MNSIICEAINNKKTIKFNYNGGTITAEPFCYGTDEKGRELLRCYQVGGYREEADPVGWRLLAVSLLTDLQLIDLSFTGARPRYDPNDMIISTIFCRI